MHEGKIGFNGCQYQEEDGTTCGVVVAGEVNLKGSICELCSKHLAELEGFEDCYYKENNISTQKASTNIIVRALFIEGWQDFASHKDYEVRKPQCAHTAILLYFHTDLQEWRECLSVVEGQKRGWLHI